MSRWSDYEAPNLGLLFYKQIYKESAILKELDSRDNPSPSRLRLDNNNDGLHELSIYVDKNKPSPFDDFYKDIYAQESIKFSFRAVLPFNASFKLKTTYPGLLVGSGYARDTKAKGDFKIGFFFDHTTGLPVIPGSSVKGVCRSVFEMDKGKKTEKKSIAAVDFIFNEILEKHQTVPDFKYKADIEKIKAELDENKLKYLIKEIFGQDKAKGSDIFFDAMLNTDSIKPFLANDFITPHKHKSNPALDPFTNPNPIQFLKVRSEVTFEFSFYFTDTEEWTKEIKELFFKQVILTIGIGAKTNVGYGQFDEGENLPGSLPPPPPEFVDQIPSNAISSLRQRSSFPGEMIDQIGVYNIYQFAVGRDVCKVKKRTEKNPTLKVSDKVTIAVKLDYNGNESLAFQVK